MSSRSKKDQCQICGGALQGNQRRWLFGGQNKKAGQPQTPTGSLRGGTRSQSSQSSSWGSTLSLGSSVSLSKSLMSVSSPSKSVDLLTVLTHILGQSVPRGGGQGEFICGKCVCLLERVFKFDTVIARVRVLSSERLQKLTQERDKIRQWVRQNYCHRHLQDFQSRSSTSEDEGEVEKEGYREMLKENMALSEYECWSEKWDTCPYFIRTGKRCRKGKGCEGCDSLRVSDSDYESVCGVPRHMPFQPFSSCLFSFLQLLQEKAAGSSLLQSLGLSLHSRERLIQECTSLISRLCVEEGAGTELANKLTENLREIISDNKAALEALRSEITEKETSTEKEIEALRKAGRDRERDLDTLNTVLQCNQDIISTLQEYQDMVQSQQESHSRTVSSLTARLRDAWQELREKEKEKKEADRALQNDREDRERGERRLRDSLEKRDKLIEVKKQFVPFCSVLGSYSERLK
ncbi:uncharacterized protein si:ch73-95l15.5 [Neolamprologus brichardi]|uniref:uncharacterized protein si:ch73-95l15.5 n=1 Tax=Neolamprologus brichardi TaxID=32507 RepID=UPI0016437906|nr:uncharacterized protein si:ch73-95l15.5 [Neolamprologus brichardi]